MPPVRSLNIACVVTVLVLAPAWAADPPPNLDEVCSKTACRTGGYDAVISVDAQRYQTVPVSRSPYLLDDHTLLVFPGETLAVQFSLDGDTLGPPISVKRYAARLPALIIQDGGSPQINPEDAGLPVIQAAMPADEVALLPPNTLLVSYGQLKPRGESGMTLVVETNLPQTLKLDAIIAEITPGAYRQHYTSTCPIMPKIWGHESWPNALGPIVLTKFRFLAQNNQLVCN